MSNVPANVQAAIDALNAKTTVLNNAVASSLQNTATALQDVKSAQADLTSMIAAAWPAPAPPPVVTPPPPPASPWDAIDKTAKTDVTAAFQKNLDAGYTDVPAGNYLIDPTKIVKFYKNSTGAVDLTGRPTTFLVCKPSATSRDCVAQVAGAGIIVKNFLVVGDRMAKLYSGSGTDEWGYGWKVTGAGSTIQNCHAIRCMGDGFGITAANVRVIGCVADQNRRNGLSGFNCPGLVINGGRFSNTGKVTVDGVDDAGAQFGPWAGIDIEPDKLATGTPNVTATIINVECSANQGSGILGYLRSEVGGSLNILIDKCKLIGNTDGVRGEAVAGKVAMKVTSSSFAGNDGAAVRANSGAVITVATSLDDANTIQGMKPRSPIFTKSGIVTAYDLKAYGTGIINAGPNHYI